YSNDCSDDCALLDHSAGHRKLGNGPPQSALPHRAVIVRRGAASCAALGPTHPKTLQGKVRVAKFRGLSVCGSRRCHTQVTSRCKNNALSQSAKEIAQCARIDAVALAFLISTE